jgi:hypothetical protein
VVSWSAKAVVGVRWTSLGNVVAQPVNIRRIERKTNRNPKKLAAAAASMVAFFNMTVLLLNCGYPQCRFI